MKTKEKLKGLIELKQFKKKVIVMLEGEILALEENIKKLSNQ